MSLNKNNIIVFFALFFSVLTSAQSDKKKKDSARSEQLDEVVITATRTLRQLSSLPMPVQLVSKADIKQSNSLRLADILNEQTGLITIPDFGGGEGIQMQGLDSQYTLILIDGVPLIGRSAGTLDLNRITVGNIKQIEIVKGASSSLYGSEAIGGVINIITDTPKYGIRGEANLRSGSFGTNDLGLSLSQRKDKLGLSFFINRFSSEGFDFDESTPVPSVSPFSNYTFDTKITYEFSDRLDLVFSGRYFSQNQDNISQNLQTQELFTGDSSIDEWNTRLTTTYKVNDNFETIFEFYATQFKTEEFLNDSNGILFSESDFNQQFIRPEFRSTWTQGENELTTGIGLTHETLERTFFSNKPIFNAPFVFAQYDWKPNENLNVIVGARYDDHNQYESQFNPKFAINYEFNKKLSVKASAGRGFKAPDFRQLFFNFSNSTVGYRVLGYNLVNTTVPDLIDQGQAVLLPGVNLNDFNSDLEPESSNNFNLGFNYKPFKKVNVDVNVFRNDISNLIDTRAIATLVGSGQNIFSYQNIDEVFTQGLEFNIAYKPNDRWRMSFGYQLLYAKDKEAMDEFESGSVINQQGTEIILFEDQYFGLFNRSRHMGNFKVFYNIPQWKLDVNLRATYRSRFGLFDSNGNNYLDTFDVFADGYSIVDIAFNKQLFKNYEIGFGADNIFNFTDPQNVNNIAGILFYGKLNIQL
jgi:outer membrane receptor for ferrienterochelin and colicins